MLTLSGVPSPSDAPSIATAGTATTRVDGIGLLGCGTVGASVARRLLALHPQLVRAIAVRDPHKPRAVEWADFESDPFEVVDDPAVRVVVECIGGVGLARELVLRAIARGKDVVTANKDLIATEGPWLAAFAARTGASLRYEAAVGGAIPIVRAMAGSLANEDVLEIGGVVNGTTNFILDAMSDGAGYDEALAEAQRLGYAETDPRADVDGHDAAHKLAILAGLAFHRPSVSGRIARRGIGALTAEDVRAGAERGWRLKLLAVARRVEEPPAAEGDRALVVEAGVTPAYVPADHPFARPRGAENVVRVVGAGCGELLFAGTGAGGDPTASAVVADVVAALESRERHVPAHAGPDLQTVPLRLPAFERVRDGVRSAIPVWAAA